MNQKFLVIGATGFLGTFIVKELIRKNIPIRILTRNKEKAEKKFGLDQDIIEGTIIDKEVLNRALEHITGIIITISAFNRKQIRQIKEIEYDGVIHLLDLAEKYQIKNLIYLSVFEKPEKNISIKQAQIKRELENYIEKSNFNYLILGIPPSCEIFFALIKKNKLIAPGGGPTLLPTIAPQDIGNIISQAILLDKFNHRRYRLLGNTSMSFKEASVVLSNLYGQNIKYQKIPLALIKLIAFLSNMTKFIFPYLSQLTSLILLMNKFPSELKSEKEKIIENLTKEFNYNSLTLKEYFDLRNQKRNLD